MKVLLTLAGVLAAVAGSAVAAKPILCYWEFWGITRTAPHAGTIDKIPTDLCTHVIYSFVGLDQQSLEIKKLDHKFNKDIEALQDLKKKNSALKVMVAVGGWNEGSAKFSKMASNAASRKRFVASVAKLVKDYNLDGFDLDWEYPGDAAPATDKANLSKLLQELRVALGSKLLTIAVGGPKFRIDAGYDVRSIAKSVDHIHVMTYDLHGPWDGSTGNHVGLYGNGLSVSNAMQAWADAGAPKKKLIMGIATYGKSFTLANPSNNGVGAPASMGQAGEVSQAGGTLYYFEICQRLKKGWKRVFDRTTKAPYAYGDNNQWVGYEDVEGIKYKTDLINKEGYGGAMVWAIGLDDQSNVCGGGKFPITSALAKGLGGKSTGRNEKLVSTPEPEPEPEPEPITSFPEPAPNVIPDAGHAADCSSGQGLVSHSSMCSRYYQCVYGQPVEMSCPGGLIFDDSIKTCNWPSVVAVKLPTGCTDA